MQQQYYLLKRPHTDVYYTIRTNNNRPAVLAVTSFNKAKCIRATITSMEEHPQKLIIEKNAKRFIDQTCKNSMLPVILFNDDGTIEIHENRDYNNDEAMFHLENMYMYY
jgi:hypothetical protein